MDQDRIAIVFAAGRGSRLAPLTDTTPKPLLKVKNKSLLEWNLGKIFPLVDKVIIVVSYLSEQITSSIGDNFLGKPIEYVTQQNPKGGTLDAFRTAIFQSNPSNFTANFLILNADDIHGSQIYEKFQDQILTNPDQALVSARIVKDSEKLKSLGIFEVNDDCDLVQIWEKPQYFVSELANSGIYYFPNKVKSFIDPTPNTTDKEHYITTDLFTPYSKVFPIKVISSDDMWLQISTPQDLEAANQYFVQ
jgi:NDP-sugar pyrophosphorylase family protein